MENTIEERLATLANYLYIGGEISLWGFGSGMWYVHSLFFCQG